MPTPPSSIKAGKRIEPTPTLVTKMVSRKPVGKSNSQKKMRRKGANMIEQENAVDIEV
jgi:hypothetical protein